MTSQSGNVVSHSHHTHAILLNLERRLARLELTRSEISRSRVCPENPKAEVSIW